MPSREEKKEPKSDLELKWEGAIRIGVIKKEYKFRQYYSHYFTSTEIDFYMDLYEDRSEGGPRVGNINFNFVIEEIDEHKPKKLFDVTATYKELWEHCIELNILKEPYNKNFEKIFSKEELASRAITFWVSHNAEIPDWKSRIKMYKRFTRKKNELLKSGKIFSKYLPEELEVEVTNFNETLFSEIFDILYETNIWPIDGIEYKQEFVNFFKLEDPVRFVESLLSLPYNQQVFRITVFIDIFENLFENVEDDLGLYNPKQELFMKENFDMMYLNY
jgi:hypothetical protein